MRIKKSRETCIMDQNKSDTERSMQADANSIIEKNWSQVE